MSVLRFLFVVYGALSILATLVVYTACAAARQADWIMAGNRNHPTGPHEAQLGRRHRKLQPQPVLVHRRSLKGWP